MADTQGEYFLKECTGQNEEEGSEMMYRQHKEDCGILSMAITQTSKTAQDRTN